MPEGNVHTQVGERPDEVSWVDVTLNHGKDRRRLLLHADR